MSEETKNNESPTCACGRGDLYMESLKLKEKDPANDTDSSIPDQVDDDNSSVDSSNRKDQKPAQGKE